MSAKRAAKPRKRVAGGQRVRRPQKSPIPTDRRSVWERRLKELQAFKKRYGHCNVPNIYPPNRQLGHWVLNLRARKKQGMLSQEAVRQLEDLGFRWAIRHRRFRRVDWKAMVAALAAFKGRHGHCNVPRGQPAHADLHAWLTRVRRYRRMGTLDPRRERELNRLGMVWRPSKERWQTPYAALIAFQKQHGHCRVPTYWPRNGSLGRWVSKLRRLRREGELPKVWIERLDRLGFVWEPRPSWDVLYAELAAYQKVHGDCLVSTLSKTHKRLGNWVRSLRAQRKQGRLSRKQIRQLDQLGFVWVVLKRS